MIDLEYNRKLILEDGEEYLGSAFGYTGEKVLELVFNTSMVGYPLQGSLQEHTWDHHALRI